MSEKKSWDIQPNRRPPTQPQPVQLPVRQVRPDRRIPMPRPVQRKPSSRPVVKSRKEKREAPARIIRNERVKQGREREPLKAQRRRARRRMSVIVFVLLFILIAAGFAAIWSSAFRIQHIEAAGPDATSIQTTALSSLTGTIGYVFPRNSIFFYPESTLRTQILNQYPDISAITISRTSFDTLAIASIPRESAFLWCGQAYASPVAVTPIVSVGSTSTSSVIATAVVPPTPSPCYDADSQGDVFAPDNSAPTDTLRVYDSLASSTNVTGSPLGQHVAEANMIPNALNFVKEIKSLGVPIVALVIRGDEADLYAQSGTRITYVLGTEEASSLLAESAFPSLNLNDGSLIYVDLRFAGKVYFRKGNASTAGVSATSTYSAAVNCYLTGKCAIH